MTAPTASNQDPQDQYDEDPYAQDQYAQDPYAQQQPATQPPSRHAALASAAAGIRVRRGRLLVEQILLIAAAILFPLGLVFIMLGWDGAAHNGHTYAQISYLISGGLFGLGLSVAGGFMYFGYWLSRQLRESRRQSALTVQALQRMEELLEASLNSRVAVNGWGTMHNPQQAANPARSGQARRAKGGAGKSRSGQWADESPTGEQPAIGSMLFATPKGTLLHRAECPVVARREDLTPVAPGTEGYGYCTMCDAAGSLAAASAGPFSRPEEQWK